MSGRPRQVSDEAIFAAVTATVDEGGPDALTVQNVAARVGVTAPAVRQRFGSKRALLLAYAEHQVLNAAQPFSALSADETGPLDQLLDGLVASGAQLGDKRTLTNNLALLQLDLTDPELGSHATNHSRALLTAIEGLIRQAIADREVQSNVDANALAEAVNTTYNGALVTWAIDGSGPLETWLRKQLEFVLSPHTTRRWQQRS